MITSITEQLEHQTIVSGTVYPQPKRTLALLILPTLVLYKHMHTLVRGAFLDYMLEDERKHLICLLSLLFVIHKYNHALKVLFSTIVNQKRKEKITFLILHVVLYKQMQTFIREYILTIVNQKRKRTLALLIIRTL